MKKALVSIVALGLLLVLLPGCGSKVSRSNYDEVQVGMTRTQVESILGTPTETTSAGGELPGIGVDATVLVWEAGDRSITVTFVNNQVISKSHTGL